MIALLLCAGSGCGPAGPKRYPVSGMVTLDGQPLVDGYISFMPATGDISPDAGKITAGRYSFESQEGIKRVEIVANRPKPGAPVDPAMGMAPFEQYIPEEYNTESSLTADVMADGKNSFDFLLKSRP